MGIFTFPAAEAGPGHDAVNFVAPKFQVREGNAASIDARRGTHGTGSATVDVVALTGAEGGTATPDVDYDFTSEELFFPDPISEASLDLPTLEDGSAESLETVNLDLKNPSRGMVTAFPNDAVLSIVDDDGAMRVSADSSTYSIFETNGNQLSPFVRIFVLRSGEITAPMSVNYATQEGSAKAPEDFSMRSGTLTFEGSEYVKSVVIPLNNDNQGENDESFDFVLSSPTGGALVEPSTVDVTIHDDDGSGGSDNVAPYTAFHHPLHGKKYSRQEAATLIAFMQDDEFGSGMDRVQLAIRKRKANGTCTWWNGTDFSPLPCDAKRWADTGAGTQTTVDYFSDTAVFTLKKLLKSSAAGTGIRNYTAFCRGWDNAGNLQTTFIKGQNRNTFEVK